MISGALAAVVTFAVMLVVAVVLHGLPESEAGLRLRASYPRIYRFLTGQDDWWGDHPGGPPNVGPPGFV
jgi:hypothetical protein